MVQEKSAKVNAYEYKGKCWNIESVQSYFKFSMEILDPAVRKELFPDDLPVFTKVRDEMPALYGDNATVVNSLVADGCQVEGIVENSILFRGVKIAPDAHIKNCIIMQDGQVQQAGSGRKAAFSDRKAFSGAKRSAGERRPGGADRFSGERRSFDRTRPSGEKRFSETKRFQAGRRA